MINIYRIITVFLSIISIIFSLLNHNDIPKNLVFLPLCFVLLFLIIPSFSKNIFKSIGITILNFSMLIRYSISPLLMSIYGVNLNSGLYLSEKVQSRAINLMIYEMILIFITFLIFQKRFYKSSQNQIKLIRPSKSSFSWLFVIVALVVILVFPEILSRYSFVWTATKLKSKEVEGISYSFLLIIVQLGHLVFTANLINLLYKYYTKKKSLTLVILSLFVVGVSSSFMVGTSRFSIVLPLVTGLFTVFLIYKPYRRLIGLFSLVISLVLIILTSILKTKTVAGERSLNSLSKGFNELNSNLQLYFSGVANVSHSLNTRLIYKPFNFDDILADLFKSVVFISKYFMDFQSAIVNYNINFYGRTGIQDQILPMIGQGYLYLGYILAPVFSIATIIIIMYLDKKIVENNSLFNIYILVYLCLKFALFNMANATILISFFTNFFVVLMVINILNKRIRLGRDIKK
ncbi:TPA: hypothetical protein O4F65_001294 [Staphylococcus aureus]|uniref:hypothetical protein n=1 Tax=Staphylococcus aureus TaxID=1280 RepID=UPI0006BA788B|nr:hypothetical protein [Staphylococcus aureus]HCZ8192641.1 hypothetical protein [Staphylococcus aureus]HCZ8196843.1 hypothetical protein [Staphylococcus aureus]HCZ8222670.1 hypothetical protein [Staphylococcus aureus]HCZ8226387.1 hypothetical protein [Staphylococcus aureus]HCZ8229066.1 hypothetical protein [Staphylococcus aureus]